VKVKMAEEKSESKYALKRQRRISAGGRTFKSLGEGPLANDSNPMPRPFDSEYYPNRPQYNHYAMQKEAMNTLLPFEKPEFIAKFRRTHAS
jgi:hypothetical protein